MDSKQHAERLTDPVCGIISAVGWWDCMYRWSPGTEDVARAEQARKAIAALVAKLFVLDHVLGLEIEAAQAQIREREAREEPGADVLAGADG